MKKLFIAMTIACVTTFSAFAIDLSIGGLIDLSPTFGSVKVKVADVSTKATTQQTMMGGKFFLMRSMLLFYSVLTVRSVSTRLLQRELPNQMTYA